MAVTLAAGPTFLHLIGLEPDLADGAARAMLIFALSLPGYAFSVAASFWLEGLGKPKPGAVMMWVANGVNLALLLLLVPGTFGLHFSIPIFLLVTLFAWALFIWTEK